MLRITRFLAVCVVGGLACPAPAAVVSIDFQVGLGHRIMSGGAGAVLPTGGPYWNVNGANGVPMALLTGAGEASGVTLLPDLYDAGATDEGDALFGDYVFGEATIAGLNAGQSYQLVIYGGATLQNIFRVGQPFDSASPAYGEITCLYGPTSLPGVNGCDYMTGMAVADALGQITMYVQPGAMSGMQLALNPEPTSWSLLGIAGLCTCLRRRRADA